LSRHSEPRLLKKENTPKTAWDLPDPQVRLKNAMVKKFSQIAGVLIAAAFLTSIATAQQVRVSRDGDAWVEELTGSLSASKTLRLRVDFGSVRVQGGSQKDITYVIRTRSYSSNEKQARHEFEAYKISASARAIGRVGVITCAPANSLSTFPATWNWLVLKPRAET